MHSFDAGIDHGREGMHASVEQRVRSGAVDVLKKHHSKSITPTVSRLPDPRGMAEIRGGLEDESSEAEAVRRSLCLSISLQLNTAMFSHIAGSQVKYGITVALVPSADTVVLCSSRSERRGDEHKRI